MNQALAILLTLRKSLDALTLGETGATALGVNLSAVRVILAVGVGIASGASVAVTGLIGFVGLIAPHLVRPLVGHRPGALLIPSALAGSGTYANVSISSSFWECNGLSGPTAVTTNPG